MNVILRKTLLWAAIVIAALVLIALGATTALWILVGGTFFRGEHLTIGTLLQIGLALLSCVGLGVLIRGMFRAAKRV